MERPDATAVHALRLLRRAGNATDGRDTYLVSDVILTTIQTERERVRKLCEAFWDADPEFVRAMILAGTTAAAARQVWQTMKPHGRRPRG